MKHIYGITVARKKVKAGREGKVKNKKTKHYCASVSSMDQHFVASFFLFLLTSSPTRSFVYLFFGLGSPLDSNDDVQCILVSSQNLD